MGLAASRLQQDDRWLCPQRETVTGGLGYQRLSINEVRAVGLGLTGAQLLPMYTVTVGKHGQEGPVENGSIEASVAALSECCWNGCALCCPCFYLCLH